MLWSMLYWGDAPLIEALFHELAHQRYSLAGDTAFNESYASFVGREGLRQWRASRGEPPPPRDASACRRANFVALIGDARKRLEAVYAAQSLDDVKRIAKRAIIDELCADYRRVRERRWDGAGDYDGWFEAPINHAKLPPVGLDHRRLLEG